jgi:hypothetical protein
MHTWRNRALIDLFKFIAPMMRVAVEYLSLKNYVIINVPAPPSAQFVPCCNRLTMIGQVSLKVGQVTDPTHASAKSVMSSSSQLNVIRTRHTIDVLLRIELSVKSSITLIAKLSP